MSVFQKLHNYFKTHDAIAEAFKMTRQNVTAWKKKGIPADRALEIENKTKGEISAIDILKENG